MRCLSARSAGSVAMEKMHRQIAQIATNENSQPHAVEAEEPAAVITAPVIQDEENKPIP